MAALSLLAIIVFSTIVSKSHAATWDMTTDPVKTAKYLCENHPAAIQATWKMEKVDTTTDVYYCTLDVSGGEDEADWKSVCEYMYPADLVEAKGDKDIVSCKYEILYLCPAGQFAIGDLCIQYNEELKTTKEAKAECAKKGGLLPSEFHGKAFFSHIINAVNPRALGFNVRTLWLVDEQKNRQITIVRGADSPLPGTIVEADGRPASYSCMYPGLKTARVYEKECNVYKEQFKLAANFHQGTCYMMSPSVQMEDNAADLHQYCQWFSSNGRVITPLSSPRIDGSDGALAGTVFEYNYILTAGEKDKSFNGETKKGWRVADEKGDKTEIFEGLWVSDRPDDKGTDGTKNLQVVAVPKPLRSAKRVLYDVPKYFRGHPICATGISVRDLEYKKCNQGWRAIMRENGQVMCAKAFTDELLHKTYNEAVAFCKTFNGFLAPMASPEEQDTILKLINEANPKPGGAMWLGAKGKHKQFKWTIDGKEISNDLSNWHTKEPNDMGGDEDCLQIYTGGAKDRPKGKWNDIRCSMGNSGGGDSTHGGVCAKFHEMS